MSSLVGVRNWWIHSAESAGTSKEEIIPQAHRFLLDLACCRTNLQLGIAENPQSGELLSKCLNISGEWWKAGWIKDRNVWVGAQCLPHSPSDGFE